MVDRSVEQQRIVSDRSEEFQRGGCEQVVQDGARIVAEQAKKARIFPWLRKCLIVGVSIDIVLLGYMVYKLQTDPSFPETAWERLAQLYDSLGGKGGTAGATDEHGGVELTTEPTRESFWSGQSRTPPNLPLPEKDGTETPDPTAPPPTEEKPTAEPTQEATKKLAPTETVKTPEEKVEQFLNKIGIIPTGLDLKNLNIICEGKEYELAAITSETEEKLAKDILEHDGLVTGKLNSGVDVQGYGYVDPTTDRVIIKTARAEEGFLERAGVVVGGDGEGGYSVRLTGEDWKKVKAKGRLVVIWDEDIPKDADLTYMVEKAIRERNQEPTPTAFKSSRTHGSGQPVRPAIARLPGRPERNPFAGQPGGRGRRVSKPI